MACLRNVWCQTVEGGCVPQALIKSLTGLLQLRPVEDPPEPWPTLSDALHRAPTSQAMLVDDLKLVYLPIAKNACSSLKQLVASLGGVDLEQDEDIHIKLDSKPTGLQFADRSEDEIRHALSAPGWMRFAVIRDPFDRLVSAYVEKFVLHRDEPRIEETVGPAYRAVFGHEELTPADMARGITFREFVEFILGQDPRGLDSHWQPQSEQLGHIAFTHLYDVRELDALAADLQAHVGQMIELPWMNASREAADLRVSVPAACDLLPADLVDPARIDLASFLPDDLRGRIAQYYAMDVTLCRMVRHLTPAAVARTEVLIPGADDPLPAAQV